METVTRTIFGSSLQTAQLLGVPHVIKENTTLNERFNVLKTAVLPDGQYPRLQYFCIGTGGVKIVAGSDNIPRTEMVQHRSTDASCFNPFPFVLRLASNDLSVAERLKYALRVQETYNGQTYYAYYLKRIDLSQVSVNLEARTVNNGITTSSEFIATSSNLVPTPPAILNQGANVLTSDYITCSAQVTLSFTQQECEELLDAAVIKYGSEDYAILSEIGMCAGLDKVISLPDASSFKEAIGVQIVSHVNTWHSIQYTQGGINGVYDLGVADPVLNLA
jgi:hypothetical protein